MKVFGKYMEVEELWNSVDTEVGFTVLEQAKDYFIPTTEDEYEREVIDAEGGRLAYYQELAAAKSLQEFADIWNANTDRFENGSTMEVVTFEY